MDVLELTQPAPVASGQGDTDASVGEKPERPNRKGPVDFMQLAFWGLLLIAISAAVIAITWPDAGGASGPVTLVAMAAIGMVFLLWIVRGAGRRIGLFPDRGATVSTFKASATRSPWLDALDEAALITERGGAPVASNTAYNELTELITEGLAETGRTLTVDRLMGANPGLAAPIYRLSKSARMGKSHREVMPPITVGLDALPAQFEISVSPLQRERVLWRLRRIAGDSEATGAADMRSLYVEDAPMGFFATRADGTLTYANGRLRDLLGLPETDVSVRVDDIMRPEFVKMLRKDRKSGAPVRADIMIRGKDGVELPVQTLTTWSGRGSESTGRTVVIEQVGLLGEQDRLTAASASRPPREDSDPMFDDAPFGAVRLDGDSLETAVLTDANQALLDLTDGRALPGVRFAELFVAEEGPEILQARLLDAINKPVDLKLAGDEVRNANVFVSLDRAGRPAVAYVIDRTEQKQLELRLAQGEKMQAIGQLAGGVAHDFNNVLQGIMLNTDKLTMRHPVGDPSFEELKHINELSHRAAELVKMLLAYARKQTFKRDVLDITDTLSEFSVLLRQLVDERIEIELSHGRDLPKVKVDKNQLETAIINLATNARDAMLAEGNGGKLTIKTSRSDGKSAQKKGFNFVEDGDYLLVDVTDTGHGMSKEVMEKIFQPFFTTKDVGVGTGLGLATVYGIIKQSGGYICPTSTVGKGTTFSLYLPALQAHELPQEEPKKAERSSAGARPVDMAGRGRILLVEDEDGVRGIAAQLLMSRGYDVEEACDGEEAMEIIDEDEEGFDLVISDVVMPGIDGPTLIQQAREKLGDARVVFISGYAERDLAKRLDDNRAVSFLPKPFTVRQLAERVKEELAARSEKAA